ncbi:MAG: hypothetical protein MH252_15135 [Thermosynechococcaceae cyanobacterium MS004]|nr:hypothetical protein [Thermosynechococcaceae cyanobacterium MS004]
MVIILVVGVLSAITAPSVMSMMDGVKVDRTIVEVRTALQSTQRQAIRGTQVCTVTLQLASTSGNNSGSSSGSQSGLNIDANTGIVDVGVNSGKGNGNAYGHSKNNDTSTPGSNTTSPSATPAITKNTVTGTCLASGEPDLPEKVAMATNIASTSGNPADGIDIRYGVLGGAEFTVQGLATSTSRDASGKIVAFIQERNNLKKKCIAISSTLGLTRVGNYVGDTDPESITKTGVCTALEWNKQ